MSDAARLNNDGQQISIKVLVLTLEMLNEQGEGQVYGKFDLRNNERTNEYWYEDYNGNKIPVTKADLTRCLITKSMFDNRGSCDVTQMYEDCLEIHHGSTKYHETFNLQMNKPDHEVTMCWYPYLWELNKSKNKENKVMDNPNLYGLSIHLKYAESCDRLLDELVISCLLPMIDIDILSFPTISYAIVGHTSMFKEVSNDKLMRDLFCEIKMSKDKDTGKYVFFINNGRYLTDSIDPKDDTENTVVVDLDKQILNENLFHNFYSCNSICNGAIEAFTLMHNDWWLYSKWLYSKWLYSNQDISIDDLDLEDSKFYKESTICPNFMNTVAVLAIILDQKGK